MPDAIVVFLDIAKFSENGTLRQKTIVESFNTELRALLDEHVPTSACADLPIIALPTGDGAALVFMQEGTDSCAVDFPLAICRRMLLWAQDIGKDIEGASVSIRIGMNYGPVLTIRDINGRPNVCGKTINFAQRIMDAADPDQLLVSNEFFDHFAGSEKGTLKFKDHDSETKLYIEDEIEVVVKHGRIVQVHVAWFIESKPESRTYPESYGKMIVSLSKLPKAIEGSFETNLWNAKSVALIQLTGENLLPILENGKKLNDELESFWVFMPSEKLVSLHDLSVHWKGYPFDYGSLIQRWRSYFARLSAERPGIDIKLGLIEDLPFYGASYLDWNSPGGHIHISPYIWGIQAQLCPGYDLEWLGAKEPEVYKTYRKGLFNLNSTVSNSLY
jgi:hypothetical protein